MSLTDIYEILKPYLEKIIELVKTFLANYAKTDAAE